MEDINNWYETLYDKTISYYRFLCEKINLLLQDYKKKMVAICHYNSYKKLNSVEKKKGLKGIYSKYGYDYVYDMGTMVERDGIDHIYGIGESIQALFNENAAIQCMLCFVDKEMNNNDILNYFTAHELNDLDDLFFRKDDLFICFRSIGCDGNSVTIDYRHLKSKQFFDRLEDAIN